MPVFTVFTPTYNRAMLLGRVYECLAAQTFRDFEWLIVDDGSTDGSRDLVQGWQGQGRIEIVYFHQENHGKHVAFNRAVERARGSLFVTLDSDDTCKPDALERFLSHWNGIPAAARGDFSGVTCHCLDDKGALVGSRFPVTPVDAHPDEFLSRYRIRGEKWGFQRTDILRAFPYPEIAGERFVPEGLVWSRIGRHYKVRFVNEALRTYKALPDGLSRHSVRLRAENPVSTCAYYFERSRSQLSLAHRSKAMANYIRFYLHSRRKRPAFTVRFETSILALAAFPLGYGAYLRDRLTV